MDTWDGDPAEQGCIGDACTPAELAEDDLARWKATVEGSLPGRPLATVDVQFTDNAAPAADRYEVSVTWHEAGEEEPSTYTLTVEV
jgi:hypothetical protein